MMRCAKNAAACVNKALERADEALRTGLLAKPAKGLVVALDALVLLAFAALMMTRTMGHLLGAAFGARLAAVMLLLVPLALMLRYARQAGESNGFGLLAHAVLAAVCAAAMLARASFLDHVSSDYEIYLSDWLAQFDARTFSQSMRENIGEYNVLYQYILFVITRLPVPALYAVKAATFVGDALLAGAAARLAGRGKTQSVLALCAVLLLPTCVIDGGMFAQCDSLYAACALWGLALALGRKPARAAACFALSLAFKLQSAFILPIVVVLWAHKRLKLRDAFVFLLTLAAVALPALLGGKGLMDILSIYTSQMGLYNGLTYNAASFFGLMETAGLDVYAYGNFGMALAFGVCALLVVAGVRMGEEAEDGEYVRLALLLVLLIVFFLPRMHERYFYMTSALSAVLAVRCGGRYVYAAAAIELATLATYWALALTLPAASLMMILSAIILLSKRN